MTAAPWRSVPLELGTDLDRGGRWTSLRTATREWCWTNPDGRLRRQRLDVQPGDAFVDAGGVEECLPTVRGRPDHGDAWSRPWQGGPEDASVEVPGVGRLRRTVAAADSLQISYQLHGEPGTRFLHAVHALLDLSPAARLEVAGAPLVQLIDEPGAGPVLWPAGLHRLGPDDGTARCALIPGCSEATVVDGDDALRFTWTADQPELCSLLVWRNLRGWPAEGPYRSIGVEPMVGRVADLATAEPGQLAEVGRAGCFRWSLRVAAWCR